MQDDDADTIARFLAGDREAARRVDDWIARAAAPFRRRLGADWEDLLQEARIETLRLLRTGSFRGEASLKAYLWQVVGHACLRRVRSLSRAPQGGADLESHPSGTSSPLERVLAHESATLLLRIFAAMPEGCRELWRLIVAGCGYEEMSARLAVSAGALRVRVLRCRRRAATLRLELLGRASASAVDPTTPSGAVTPRPEPTPLEGAERMTMEHAEAEELLPWLLNDSLDPGERRAVEDHVAACATCQEALAEAELAFAAHALHPTEAQLVDLAWNPLSSDHDAVRAHVDQCPACAEELALLRASRAQQEAEEDEGQAAVAPARTLPFPAPVPVPVRRRWAMAASIVGILLLGALGWKLVELGSRGATAERELASARAEAERLRGRAAAADLGRDRAARELTGAREELARLRQPELNVPVFELLPDELVLRGAPAAPLQLVEVPGDRPRLTLILARPTGAPRARTLEVRDLSGALLWRGEGLLRHAGGDYTVTVPVSLLPPAGAEIRLLDERGEPAGRYRLRLRAQPRPS